MRKHSVKCRIEEKTEENRRNIQYYINYYYVQEVERILEHSELSREEKTDFIQEVENRIKEKIKSNT